MAAIAPASELLPVPGTGRRFTARRRVRLGDVDRHGRMRLDAIARHLQDVASDDAADSGLDGGWVVRRTLIVAARPAVLGEDLHLTTFCTGTGRSWAERRTSIVGDAGRAVEAVSLWVHVDPATGRPLALGEAFHARYGEAAGERRVSTRLALPGPPPDAGRARGRCGRSTSTCSTTSTTPATGRSSRSSSPDRTSTASAWPRWSTSCRSTSTRPSSCTRAIAPGRPEPGSSPAAASTRPPAGASREPPVTDRSEHEAQHGQAQRPHGRRRGHRGARREARRGVGGRRTAAGAAGPARPARAPRRARPGPGGRRRTGCSPVTYCTSPTPIGRGPVTATSNHGARTSTRS